MSCASWWWCPKYRQGWQQRGPQYLWRSRANVSHESYAGIACGMPQVSVNLPTIVSRLPNYSKIDSMQVWYRCSFVCSWSWGCCQTLLMKCMAVKAMPISLRISGWHLPVVHWTEPGYVNCVIPSTLTPPTDRLDIGSPRPRFWAFVFCQDTCRPNCAAVDWKASKVFAADQMSVYWTYFRIVLLI